MHNINICPHAFYIYQENLVPKYQKHCHFDMAKIAVFLLYFFCFLLQVKQSTLFVGSGAKVCQPCV